MAAQRRGPLRVGITIGLRDPGDTPWSNGFLQNALFLAEALRPCDEVQSVCLLNTTTATPQVPAWDMERWPTYAFTDRAGEVDLVIELGGQVGAGDTRQLHDRGARLISYCCGGEYVPAMEAMLFNRPLWGSSLFVNREYDAIWVTPQVAATSAGYFSTLRRRPVEVAPILWDPVLLEQRCAGWPSNGTYAPRPGPRRLAVMEPNADVTRFCLYPALIADKAYRRNRGAIGLLQVTHTGHIAHASAEFIALMNQLDIVREHKAVFLGAQPTPDFLAANADVVVSHQWGQPLDHFHLEVCWQGFPLVHNASLCADLGYFYEGNDIDAGAGRLLEALESHDTHWAAYRDAQRARIGRFLPSNPEVTRAYSRLLHSVFEEPR